MGDGTLVSRRGWKRLNNLALAGYTIRSIHPFNVQTASGQDDFLIVVGTTLQSGVVNNVKVVAYNLKTEVVTTISPSTKTWQSASGYHYGFVVNNTFYGGAEKDPMYSWNPTDGWVNDVSTHTFPAFIEDRAYDDGIKVSYTYTPEGEAAPITSEFVVKKDAGILQGTEKHPVTKWKLGEVYTRGDRVKVKLGANTYFSVFKCVEKHKATAARKPGDDTGNRWKLLTIPAPADDNGKINTKHWEEILDAPQTKIAVWWANRPWFRSDNINMQVVQYGHLVDEETLEWDPTDYSTGSKRKGVETVAGAGRIPFPTGKGDRLTGFMPYGSHLIVFFQKKTFVLTGENPETQYKRELAPVGCVGPRASTEHEGLVYFFSSDGIFYTDGTEAQPVPGLDAVKNWLANSVRWDGNLDFVTMWSADGFVWIALPTGKDNVPDRTLVYDPVGKSFWKMDFAPAAVGINRKDGLDRVFFSFDTDTGTHTSATYAWTGVAHRSTSTRTLGAVTETNLLFNPSFEAKDTTSKQPYDWDKTAEKVKVRATKEVARRGNRGAAVTNKHASEWHGITQLFSDVDATTHYAAIYCRRPHWKRNDKDPSVKFRLGSDNFTPTFEKVGRGWFKASITYVGMAASRAHGWVIAPGVTVEMDMALVAKGTDVPYFDGDGGVPAGGHAVMGGGNGLVHQYGRVGNEDIYTDDTGQATYSPIPVAWSMRTTWFPFGLFREERRIRKVWALVRGAVVTTIRGFSNYDHEVVTSAEITPGEEIAVQYLEGQVGDFPDSYAIGFEIEGEASPAAVQGIGVDTRFRRGGRFGS